MPYELDFNINYTLGPDQLVPVDDYVTWKPDGHVKLRVTERGAASEPPISVPGLLNRTVARYPDETALATKRNGNWERVTYK